MKLKIGEFGESFEPTENDGSDSWADVTGIANMWVGASVALFSKEEPVFDKGCVLSEWGRT